MKKNNVVKSSILVLILSLAAKVLGLVKTTIQATYFGTSTSTDAYNIAYGYVDDILFMLTTAIATAFVPLYIQRKKGKKEYVFASEAVYGLGIIALGITIITIIIAPMIIRLTAPTFGKKEIILASNYLRIISLGFVFSLEANIYTNLLNAEKRYGFSTFCSFINSIVLILGIILFGSKFGVWILAISIPISFFIQWIFLYSVGKKYGKISLTCHIWNDSVKIILSQALPVLIGQATVEINQAVDRALLSSVGEGIITAISYSMILYQFASTLILAPLQTVMFTELSETGAKKNYNRLSIIIVNCYKIVMFVCIPTMLVIATTSNDIVKLIFGYGRFTSDAVQNCAFGLSIYGLCLWPVCLKIVTTRAYYALNDTRRPMVIGIFEVALNITLSFITSKRFGVLGILGSTVVAAVVFIVVMIIDFNKRHVYFFTKESFISMWKYFLGGVCSIMVIYLLKDIFIFNNLIDFISKTIIAFSCFACVLIILKDDTFTKVIKMLKI